MDETPSRRRRLEAARLYFICDGRPGGRKLEDVLPAVLAAGVDVFQLRDKHAGDRQLIRLGEAARRRCEDAGALFFLNDRADLAVEVGADGVHIGQDDIDVGIARAIVGPDRIVGLSTHTPEQIEAAAIADYIGVGPVYETPTKPDRPAAGLDLVRHAAVHARMPFFAIGGIDVDGVAAVRAAGAERVAVVRAIAEARDPARAAGALRAALDLSVEAGVG